MKPISINKKINIRSWIVPSPSRFVESLPLYCDFNIHHPYVIDPYRPECFVKGKNFCFRTKF